MHETLFENNFFKRLTLTEITFNQNDNIDFGFHDIPSFLLVNEGGDIVEYSFDGKNVFGDLKSKTFLICNKREISEIWFRTKNGVSTELRIEAICGGDFGGFANTETSMAVNNFPENQVVSGTIDVGNVVHVVVDHFPEVQMVDGYVAVANFPVVQDVHVTNSHVTIDALPAVEINNFPSTQVVSGNVVVSGSVNVGNIPHVVVDNFPTTFEISNFPSTQMIDGSVLIENFPLVQTVDGYINVANFPTLQVVSISNITHTIIDNFPSTQSVSGTVDIGNIPHVIINSLPGVNVDNFPSTQIIGGTVSIDNLPSVQDTHITNVPHVVVDTLPTIAVNNFPSTQAITVGSLPLPSGASTEAKQDAVITKLTSIDNKLPGLGAQSTTNSVSVMTALSGSFAVGQKAVTTTASPLSATTTAFKNGIVLNCSSFSTASVFYGPAGVSITTGAELMPGASLVLPMQDLNLIYVVASTPSTVSVSWSAFV